MAGLDVSHRRFVRIQGPDGPLGTGFRLSARRVLTGHHVVQGSERFWVLDPNPEDMSEWAGSEESPAKIVWAPEGDAEAEEALDAALLETEKVEGIRPFTRILDKELTPTGLWEGYGYPREGASRPEDRQLLDGTFAGIEANQSRYGVNVRGGRPDKATGWKGISGAPIFAQTPFFAGWTLVGLLRRTFKDLGAGRIQAVALPALLAVPEFREALELPSTEDYCGGLLEDAERLVSPDLARDIAPHHDRWLQVWEDGNSTRDLVFAICKDTPAEEVAVALAKAYGRLLIDSKSATAANQVWELAHSALPAAFLHQERPPFPGPWAVQFTVDVLTDLWVEMAMAAREGKPMALEAPPDLDEGLPQAIYKLPDPKSEPGVDPKGEQRASDAVQSLAQHLGVLQDGGTPSANQKALAYIAKIGVRKPGGGVPTPLSPDQLSALGRPQGSQKAKTEAILDTLREWLTDWAKDNRRFYVIADSSTEDKKEFLKQLGALLPEIWQVSLESSYERLKRENRVADAFRDMYRSKHRKPEETP